MSKTNGVPDRVVIDKSDANMAGLQGVNMILKFTGSGSSIDLARGVFSTSATSISFERPQCGKYGPNREQAISAALLLLLG